MTNEKTKNVSNKSNNSVRQDRLSQALRVNLLRRKKQKRAQNDLKKFEETKKHN